MVVLPVLFLLGSLFHCGRVEAQSSFIQILKDSAVRWNGPLNCGDWDCNCAFTRQRSCCCAANDMFQLEDDTFTRVTYLWHDISRLKYSVHEFTDSFKVAFKAIMGPAGGASNTCFGPFNANVSIPYSQVTLNHYNGFNPSLGIFTAPIAGVYVFSFTVYSDVEKGERLYHKVRLMKNGEMMVSVWEDNREDHQDNANQGATLELQRGDQVYVELMHGRKLCRYLEHNVFTGYILYPYPYHYNE